MLACTLCSAGSVAAAKPRPLGQKEKETSSRPRRLKAAGLDELPDSLIKCRAGLQVWSCLAVRAASQPALSIVPDLTFQLGAGVDELDGPVCSRRRVSQIVSWHVLD